MRSAEESPSHQTFTMEDGLTCSPVDPRSPPLFSFIGLQDSKRTTYMISKCTFGTLIYIHGVIGMKNLKKILSKYEEHSSVKIVHATLQPSSVYSLLAHNLNPQNFCSICFTGYQFHSTNRVQERQRQREQELLLFL